MHRTTLLKALQQIVRKTAPEIVLVPAFAVGRYENAALPDHLLKSTGGQAARTHTAL